MFQVVEKLKPDAKENFFDGVNLKQAMVFMSILAMVLAVTHLVFSILGESSQKSCVVRPPAMLALILLTSLLQLAFIVSVGLLAMTTTLVDAVVHCEPQLGVSFYNRSAKSCLLSFRILLHSCLFLYKY